MKNIILLCVIVIVFLLPGIILAQVREEWVARYNGTGNTYDRALAIAVDSFGNVYVTGQSIGIGTDFDYATVKYNSIGTQIWVARYNGLGNGVDTVTAIAVDSSGNVYVTGVSIGIGTGGDYAIVKYDTNGNELWVARYNEQGSSDDRAERIIVDTIGNVYVTGKSFVVGGGGIFNYVTVKYDSNGNQLWVVRYKGPEQVMDFQSGIVVDLAGNVYVTGVWYSYADGAGFDYLTIKYDMNGNEQWVRRYNGPANSHDYGTFIAVDTAGNVYVSGTSYDESTGDYATIKYDTNGNQLWVARYGDILVDAHDEVSAIAVDSFSNVYVSGKSLIDYVYPWGGYDYVTVKYSPTGRELWIAGYDGPDLGDDDLAKDMVVDSLGNVCLTGSSRRSYYDSDYATVKYASDGTELWSSRYDGGGIYGDFAEAIAIDPFGNVYVTGYSYNTNTEYDYVTIKYSDSPPVPTPVETPVGNNVSVDLGSGVTVTFSSVTVAGDTTLTTTETGPPPLTGFKLAGRYYEITTTAVYTGPVTVTIVYDDTGMTAGQEKTLKLFHLESGVWIDVTTSLDTVNNIITGQVTSLSLFAIMFELGPPGWDEGKKTGWQDEDSPYGLVKDEKSPDGFDSGKKFGWEK